MPTPKVGDVVARVNRRTELKEGDTARIHVDRNELHFFDPETGKAITE